MYVVCFKNMSFFLKKNKIKIFHFDLNSMNQNYKSINKFKRRNSFKKIHDYKIKNCFMSQLNFSKTFKYKVYFLKYLKIELIYISIFKKILKTLFKKSILKKNYWVYWGSFYPLTKKSKNSRMGKGKGLLLRWVYLCPYYFCFGKFNVFSVFRLKLVFNKFSKLVKCKPLIF